MDFRNMRTSMESVTGLFETLRSLHKELEIITMEHQHQSHNRHLDFHHDCPGDSWHLAVTAQRAGAWRWCRGTGGAGVVIKYIFTKWSLVPGLLSNDFQVPWQEVLRGPDAIDLWLDRIVRWFNTFLSNTNILTWNLDWSTCWALFGNENLFLLLLGTWQYGLLHQFTKYCSLTGLWCKNQRLEAVKLFT